MAYNIAMTWKILCMSWYPYLLASYFLTTGFIVIPIPHLNSKLVYIYYSVKLTITHNSNTLWVSTVEITFYFILTVNQSTLIATAIDFM